MNNLLNKEKIELIPNYCPSCGSVLEIESVHLHCHNTDCFEKNIQIIVNWVKKCNMDQISDSTVRLLYDNLCIKNIIDLYFLEEQYESLRELPGMGLKKIENLFYQIEKSKSMTIVEFLARLSIDSIGEKAIIKLGIKTIKDLWLFNKDTYVTGQKLIAYRIENEQFIKDLINVLSIKDIKDKGENKMKVCMTGTGHESRVNLIHKIEEMGYEFVSSVTKDTNILICEDVNGESVKLQKARKAGIKLVSYVEFFV